MSISERLKEERQRLGLNQTDFGAVGGVTKKTQMLYESGERAPDAEYLAAVAASGADVQYIVTGQRSDMALTPDERELLALFRAASLPVKAAAVGALKGGAASSAKFNFGGGFHGQFVEGDQTVTAPMIFTSGGKKPK